MLVRIVRMTFQEDKVEDFLANFHQNKQHIRHFEGCQHLELLRDADKSNIFCTYSIWENETHLENYRNSALFKEVWKFTKSLFLEKPIAFSAFRLENV